MVNEVWRTDPLGDVTSPSVVNGVIYLTGYDLIALNASTGEIIWRQRAQWDPPPIVENGIVYTSHGAFNATTGAELWSFQGDRAVAVANGIYYTMFRENENSSHMVIALNASSAEKLWDYGELYDTISAGITIKEGIVYFGTGTHFYALDAYTGEPLWEVQMGIIYASSPAVSDGCVYFSSVNVTKRDYNLFYCLDALTGKEIWHARVYMGSSPAIAHGCVYVGGNDGQFFAFNATTGAKIWNYTVRTSKGYGIEFSPAVADDVVYVGADDGYLYAFNASTGIKLWRYNLGDVLHFQGSAAIAAGRIYIGSEDNFLVALEAEPATAASESMAEVEIALVILLVVLFVAVGVLLLRRHNLKKAVG
ncbi:MAG: PQQ-binding-like beta-propeller repeat protein [Candidatus Bathyarchaeota archaeon]|nr:PQQ-binding-like beta-propeller repeat protein [Candidatus Bathyarchaeota archaeon]